MNSAANLPVGALPAGVLRSLDTVSVFRNAGNMHNSLGVQATCPAGKKAVGGGYVLSGQGSLPATTDLDVTSSAPAELGAAPFGWFVQARERPVSTSENDDWGVSAWVVCALVQT